MQIESCYSLLQTTFWLLRALGSGMSHLSCLSSIMSHQRPHCPLGQSTYHHLSVFQTGPTLSPASEPFHIPSCSILLRCIIHLTSLLVSTGEHLYHISGNLHLDLFHNFALPTLLFIHVRQQYGTSEGLISCLGSYC